LAQGGFFDEDAHGESAKDQRQNNKTEPGSEQQRAYQNAKTNTPHTARMAHDQALNKVMQSLLKEDSQVYKQFVENESFKRFVSDMVFHLTSAT
jgi:type I restriction enzyme R subunit